jgi:hypothetical protein
MIFKELDPFVAQSKFDRAGRKAEEQMAHYLLRFFGKSESVDVLNGIRIEIDGEIAQMDHIVLHPLGILIVESKSVGAAFKSKMTVNGSAGTLSMTKRKHLGCAPPLLKLKCNAAC